MPRSSMPSVSQFAGPGTAGTSATPAISDSANGRGRRARCARCRRAWSRGRAGGVPARDGAPAGRTTKLANRADPGPTMTPTSPAPSWAAQPRDDLYRAVAVQVMYSSARVPDTTSFTCIQRSYVHRAEASQADRRRLPRRTGR